jgi:hypothetical protein
VTASAHEALRLIRPLQSVSPSFVYTQIFALAVIPFAGIPGPEIPGITAFLAATVFATELSTSFLLFVHFRANPHWSLLILGSAFLYSALMIVTHLLTFPGAVLTDRPLVGGSRQAPGYIYVSWVTAEVKAKLDAQGLVPAGLCGTDSLPICAVKSMTTPASFAKRISRRSERGPGYSITGDARTNNS